MARPGAEDPGAPVIKFTGTAGDDRSPRDVHALDDLGEGASIEPNNSAAAMVARPTLQNKNPKQRKLLLIAVS